MISEVEGDNSLSVKIGWHLVTRLAVGIHVTVMDIGSGVTSMVIAIRHKTNQPASICIYLLLFQD